MKRIGIYIVIVVCILSCISSRRNLLTETRLMLVDTRATEHTAALFYNLRQLTGKRVVYGQHNYEMDGFDSDSTRWRDEANRCDAYDVTGAYPALASFDFLHFTNPRSWETKELNYIQEKFHVAYNRGNVITFCWHYYNPVTGGNFYDTTQVVRHILPGGSYHATFKADLKIIADFAHNAKGDDGELIPIIFRPWHEFDGNWFWWGKNHCSVEEFKKLYRFTVTYLRDSLEVHNFLYAFSPDCGFTTEAEYLERYPGDEMVDVIGLDTYQFNRNIFLSKLDKSLAILDSIGKTHDKVYAVTEIGYEGIPDAKWWTGTLLPALTQYSLAYVLVWRNARERVTHFYAPYPGQVSATDFVEFYKHPKTLFAEEVNLYQ